MRASQLSPTTAEPAENPGCLVVVPVHCRCLAHVDHARYDIFDPTVEVTVDGMIVGDAVVTFGTYTRDGEWVSAEFTGTVPVHTNKGVLGAIERIKKATVEVWGHGVIGVAHHVQMHIIGIVTLVAPDGSITQLAGAER